ncbi:MAG: hypothetical protein JSS66_15405 [Armatimonadetes bacterium]|nr:hypothetical protein [Armatimonadota bacterium]
MLKQIHAAAVPRALELAERYRLLNEPEQAASICHDVLAIDPDNATAVRSLFLATTEMFGHRRGPKLEEAERIAGRMGTEYERVYYAGVACERWGRVKLQSGEHASMAASWIHQAMDLYERAEKMRPEGNDDAILRWNACARLIEELPERKDAEHEQMYGD